MSAAASPTERARTRRAQAAILLVTVLWGFTFVWMKQAVLASDRVLGTGGLVAGVGLFMTLRFGLAALVLALVPGARRGLDRGAWSGGLVLGALILGGFLLQMFGLQGVSPPVSAFLTSLYVLFTALLLWAGRRRPVGRWLLVGALLATFGAGFIGGPPQLTFGGPEWLTVGCAFVFAVHILATDRITRRHAPLASALASFVWVTVGSALTLLAGMAGAGAPSRAGLLDLLRAPDFALPLLLAALLATVLALSLMNLFQRDLDPVRAAILYAIEPVWAALVALGMGLAEADAWLVLGGAALILGNLAAELGPGLTGRPAATLVGRETAPGPPTC